MKKMTLVAIALFLGMAGFAQAKFGVQAIGTLSDASVKITDQPDFSKETNITPGGGLVAEFDLGERVSLRTGINYLQHRLQLESKNDPDFQATAENKLHYLQLPVNVLYNLPMGEHKFYVGAGGFINYGISGESVQTFRETELDGSVTVTKETLKAFNKTEDNGADLKRVDVGVSALVGIRLSSGIFANIGYQLGLTNSSEDEGTYKNRGLQFGVGYFF